jgi:hypothetical protein
MSINNSNTKPESFDVFLCHNTEDKPEIRRIADDLIKQGIKPWLDEREIKPGELWQAALEEQISTIKSAIVFVGVSGFGPWQDLEMKAFINEFVKHKCPVIPAILPSAKKMPPLPIFLNSLHYVDFRVLNPNPIDQLLWGITGKKQSRARVKYTGDRLSLNFQEIEIRSVIAIFAEFIGQNIVAGDDVTGTITLKLDDVPWDEALDFIMMTKGLEKFELGSITLIAPIGKIKDYKARSMGA